MVFLTSQVPYVGKCLLIMLVTPIETFKQRVVHVAIGPNTWAGKCKGATALRLEGCMVRA